MKINILVVEDEVLVAQRMERLIRSSDVISLGRLSVKSNLPQAQDFLRKHTIDLLLLDLNLQGKDGFSLLKDSVSKSFQTIIVSAHSEKAISAFEYGVLDFIPKPFNKERIDKALSRLTDATYRAKNPVKYLAVLKRQRLELIQVDEIKYLKGAGNYSEIYLQNGDLEVHDKSLHNLILLLPPNYERVHKSYIVNMELVASISYQYEISLIDGSKIPISRSRYHEIKTKLA